MTVARLKEAIAAGKTGDKSAGFDPAAAPLGTDDEAAGFPVPPPLADRVLADEQRPDLQDLTRQNGTPRLEDTRPGDSRLEAAGLEQSRRRGPSGDTAWLMAGAAAIIAVATAIGVFWGWGP